MHSALSAYGALELVSADGAPWIDEVVRERAPQARRCMDPFHVVQWASAALDAVRRGVWNELRQGGDTEQAKQLEGVRRALWKNPEHLKPRQRQTLAWVATANAPLYRAYLLEEALRSVFHCRRPSQAIARLYAWLAWACRSRLAPFVRLSHTVRRHHARIEASLRHGLSNALVEGKNTQLRLLHRIAHGFHDVNAFIALAMLKLAGICPPLPGRTQPTDVS